MVSPKTTALAIVSGALEGTVRPGAAARFEKYLDRQLATLGQSKLTKAQARYIAAFPPPFFWVYNCGQCRFWALGSCDKVEGDISEVGWCRVWTPPTNPERPFSWVRRLQTLPPFIGQAASNLFTDPFTTRGEATDDDESTS